MKTGVILLAAGSSLRLGRPKQLINYQGKTLIQKAIETGSVDQLSSVIAIVRETGALEASRKAAMSEAQRAVDAAQYLPDGEYKDALVALASQLLERRT